MNRKSIDDAAEDFTDKFHPKCTSLLPPPVRLRRVSSDEDHLIVVLQHALISPPVLSYIKKVDKCNSPIYHSVPRVLSPDYTSQNADHGSIGLNYKVLTCRCPQRCTPLRCLAHSKGSKPSQGDHRSVFVLGIKRHTVHRPSVMAKGFHDLSEKPPFTVKRSLIERWPGLRFKRSPILCS